MHSDHMSYAPTFKDALAGLVSGGGALAQASLSAATEHARRAFDDYRKLTAEGRFEEAGARLRAVGDALALALALALPADRALPMR